MNIAQLRRELSRGKGRPCYCLYGPETFLVEESLRALVGSLVPLEEQALGVVRFYADECAVDEVLSEARTQPFLSQKRVVIVRRAEAWEGLFTSRRKKVSPDEPSELETEEEKSGDPKHATEVQDLLGYLSDPNPSTHLIFVATRVDNRMPVVRRLNEMEALVECAAFGEGEAVRWVLDRANALGCSLTRQEAALLVEHVGADLQRLANEIEKLSEYMSRDRVDASEAIELLAAGGRERRAFELTDAIVRQDTETALHRLEALLTIGEGSGPVAPLRILGSLAWQVRRVWLVRDSLHKGLPDNETYNRVSKSTVRRLSRWHLRQLAELKETAERFSETDLMRVLRRLLQADAELKGEGTSDRRTLEALVIDLCGTGQAERAGS